MEELNQVEVPPAPVGLQLLVFVGSLSVLVGVLYYSYAFPYPSGKPPDLWSFAAFWLREILLLSFAVTVLLFLWAAWLRRLVRRGFAKGT
jgi:hypothetical protein